MAKRTVAGLALAVMALLAFVPRSDALAFGGAGEADMPTDYYCLRGVYGTYIIAGPRLSGANASASLNESASELVPAGADGCQGESVLADSSSVFYSGAEGVVLASSPPPAKPVAPMVSVDLAYYLAIYSAHGVEAADAWARSQHFR